MKFQQTSFCCWIIPINYLETLTRITGFGQAFILNVVSRLNVGERGKLHKHSHFHTFIFLLLFCLSDNIFHWISYIFCNKMFYSYLCTIDLFLDSVYVAEVQELLLYVTLSNLDTMHRLSMFRFEVLIQFSRYFVVTGFSFTCFRTYKV
jgi:hypothetical protein